MKKILLIIGILLIAFSLSLAQSWNSATISEWNTAEISEWNTVTIIESYTWNSPTSSGSYSGSWADHSNAIDGDLDTYTRQYVGSGGNLYYIYFTFPETTVKAIRVTYRSSSYDSIEVWTGYGDGTLLTDYDSLDTSNTKVTEVIWEGSEVLSRFSFVVTYKTYGIYFYIYEVEYAT